MTAKSRGKQKIREPLIPSFDIFRQEIMRIYPEGDLMSAYQRIEYCIENEKFCADGTRITYRLIMDKFASHIRQWNIKYGSREPKYIGKADEEKRKDIWDFVYLKWYEREFITSLGQGEKNKYLFGDFPLNYLNKQLATFKKRFPDV
jgi:hypothetical protein